MKKLLITFAAVLTMLASVLPSVLARANDAGPLDTVAISPASALVAVNGTRQFTAVARDAANQTVSNVTYNWTVIAGGGTINATSGLFTAGNITGTFNETVQVTAIQGNITRSSNATVIAAAPGQLVSLEVHPEAVTLPVNGTRQFTAVAKDAFNHDVSNVTYNWSVVAGGGTINATSGLFTAGNVTGTFNGTVRVTAVMGTAALNSSATVVVSTQGVMDHVVILPANANVAINGTRQFTAVAKDAFNHDVSNVTYNWSVVAGGGTINATNGLFTAGNVTGTFNGTVSVTAVQGNITKNANATVSVASAKAGGKQPPGWEKGRKKGWGDDKTPPGWEHGNKKGWGDNSTPPGLAKGQDDDQGENEAEHANPAPQAKPANPAPNKGNNDNPTHGNSGNTPVAGNANRGNKGKD
jgi:hypothetical protein